MARPRARERHDDDLRADYDGDDHERVGDSFTLGPYGRGGPSTERQSRRAPQPLPPEPRRADEVVCRSCHLLVPRGNLGPTTALLVCRDCFR